MKRTVFLIAILLSVVGPSAATPSYPAKGLVLKVDKFHNSLLISCEKIPGYMDAMIMSFPVKDPRELDNLNAGAMVEFTLVVEQQSPYIEKIQVHRYESAEQDPISARRLKLLDRIVKGSSAPRELKTGEPVPDFSLVDQNRQSVTLSQFSGRVVVLTFMYTHCALPDFCFRTANNLRLLQKRFGQELGRALILITITFDPARDTPEVMGKYGKTWNADPRNWRLLTGAPSEVEKVCNAFGISFWQDEGLMTHSLHTFVLDRERKLVAGLEGNEFSADQLGDLVQTVLARAPGTSLQTTSQ